MTRPQTARPDQANPDLPSLTGLRFITMLPVFLAHASFETWFDNDEVNGIFLYGMGTFAAVMVSFFFVLTGFVMTWSRRPKDTPRRFWRRRLVRVVPSHLVTYLIAVALMLWAGATLNPTAVFTQVFLLQAWVPDPAYFDTGNSVTWSLSADMAFYALFPALVLVVERIREDRLWLWMVPPVVVIMALPAVGLTLLPETPEMPLGGVSVSQYWLVFFNPLARLLECLLGMLLARVILSGRWVGIKPWLPAVALFAVYLAGQPLPFLYQLNALTLVPVLLLVGAVAQADLTGRRTYLSGRRMVYLGELSFGFYLMHNLVLKYGHLAFGTTMVDGEPETVNFSTPVGILMVLLFFLASMLAAWLLHTLVEKPIVRAWSKPRSLRKSTPVAQPAPAQP
ncbi:peptidoglycan/LPS O-acetylase OafA/YrhL [Crossiella equi]|uniref:Peptidoglycan/LPS O-acetylase OafA/YrhL n=1 Tax=Crossiella equi TaxID=130796 RepID=A0ABS5AS15_9PSEU|nr:acyltransferase [Crossiella equi]MBP2479356.1 peptidoglycan/LPS O-acetylase OafA/YrhL [Crossiella equi]